MKNLRDLTLAEKLVVVKADDAVSNLNQPPLFSFTSHRVLGLLLMLVLAPSGYFGMLVVNPDPSSLITKIMFWVMVAWILLSLFCLGILHFMDAKVRNENIAAILAAKKIGVDIWTIDGAELERHIYEPLRESNETGRYLG